MKLTPEYPNFEFEYRGVKLRITLDSKPLQDDFGNIAYALFYKVIEDTKSKNNDEYEKAFLKERSYSLYFNESLPATIPTWKGWFWNYWPVRRYFFESPESHLKYTIDSIKKHIDECKNNEENNRKYFDRLANESQ